MVVVIFELYDSPSGVSELWVVWVEGSPISVDGSSYFVIEGIVYGVARVPACELRGGGGGVSPQVVLSVLAIGRCP